jgi:hypothetical protein
MQVTTTQHIELGAVLDIYLESAKSINEILKPDGYCFLTELQKEGSMLTIRLRLKRPEQQPIEKEMD